MLPGSGRRSALGGAWASSCPAPAGRGAALARATALSVPAPPVTHNAERSVPSDTIPGLSKLPHAVSKEVRDEELLAVRERRVRTSTRQNYRTELRLFAAWIRRERLQYNVVGAAVFPAVNDRDESKRHQRVVESVTLCSEAFREYLHANVGAKAN
jgi:hypothetical protein